MSITYIFIDIYNIFYYHRHAMKLKELRIKAVLSQEDLAKKANISAATVNRLEKGKTKPNFITIRKLAEALKVEPGEIEF